MKYKTYTKEEVEQFMENNFIDFEDEEMNKAIETIATKGDTFLEIDDNVSKTEEDEGNETGDLIIRIKLYES